MSIPSDLPIRPGRSARRRALMALGITLLAAGAGAAVPAGAFPPVAAIPGLPALPVLPAIAAAPSPQGDGAPSGDARALRQEIEAAYEVLPLRDGVLLRPRQPRSGVRSIEVAGDSVAVNGERVSEGVLRAWLVEDAGPVLRLAALPAAERRALFELPASGAAPRAATGSTGEAAGTEPGEPGLPGETTEPSELPGTPEATTPVPPVPPVPPAPSTDAGHHVEVFGSVTVEPGEMADEVVVVGGPARVNGKVLGDVVAVGGAVWIDGWVGGDVLAVGNSVHLGPKAEVMGNAQSVFGSVHRAPGARVHGEVHKIGIGPGPGGWDVDSGIGPWHEGGIKGVFGEAASLALMALLLCLTLLLGRRRVEQAEARIIAQPWQSGVVGLLSFFAFWPLVIIGTVLTCCLAVLLYPVIAVLVLIVVLVGFTAVSYRVGRWAEARFGWRLGNPYLVMLFGFALLEVLTFISHVIALGGGLFHMVAWMFFVAGGVIRYAALFVGVGAVLTNFFEARAARRRALEASLPPAGYPPAPAVPPAYPPAPTGPSDYPAAYPPAPSAYPPEWTSPASPASLASPPAPPAPPPSDSEPR